MTADYDQDDYAWRRDEAVLADLTETDERAKAYANEHAGCWPVPGERLDNYYLPRHGYHLHVPDGPR